ncbi:hypothetical protein H4Q26_006677 [Puccinia striiformis f. sp. tritici PST-130]|nr:hypothetical protein H4Q26_006677 [Puccinia striiformis f. sp. tritici PST-130]
MPRREVRVLTPTETTIAYVNMLKHNLILAVPSSSVIRILASFHESHLSIMYAPFCLGIDEAKTLGILHA